MKNTWIQELVKDKSFADVGGLWGTVNERVSVAIKAEASEATMIDIANEESELWRKFHTRCTEFGIDDYHCISTDITEENNLEAIGTYDVVHCSGILYHLPDPLVLLQHLGIITNEYLMFGTTIIPSDINFDDESMKIEGGQVYFVPALNNMQKNFFAKHFDREGIKIMGINWEHEFKWYVDNQPNFTPWWWLFTREYVETLLELVGFEVIDSYESWPNKAYMFLCKKVK